MFFTYGRHCNSYRFEYSETYNLRLNRSELYKLRCLSGNIFFQGHRTDISLYYF